MRKKTRMIVPRELRLNYADGFTSEVSEALLDAAEAENRDPRMLVASIIQDWLRARGFLDDGGQVRLELTFPPGVEMGKVSEVRDALATALAGRAGC